MERLKSIIIEDEIDAQELLKAILFEFCPQVKIIGISDSTHDAIQKIDMLRPHIVFMDIQLSNGDAFEILEKIENRNFKLIIISAFDEFALKAFQYEAIDYIVKPYDPEEVVRAVKRVQNSSSSFSFSDELMSLLRKENYDTRKISISTANKFHIIPVKDIIRLESDGSYCKVIIDGEKDLLVSKTLKQLRSLLPIEKFFRIHQTHLVNLDWVSKISKEDGGFVVLKNDTILPLAKRRKKAFLELLTRERND